MSDPAFIKSSYVSQYKKLFNMFKKDSDINYYTEEKVFEVLDLLFGDHGFIVSDIIIDDTETGIQTLITHRKYYVDGVPRIVQDTQHMYIEIIGEEDEDVQSESQSTLAFDLPRTLEEYSALEDSIKTEIITMLDNIINDIIGRYVRMRDLLNA